MVVTPPAFAPAVPAPAVGAVKVSASVMLLPSAAVRMMWPAAPAAAVTPPSWVEKLFTAVTTCAALTVPAAVCVRTLTPLTDKAN
jgi:hypothetical protein